MKSHVNPHQFRFQFQFSICIPSFHIFLSAHLNNVLRQNLVLLLQHNTRSLRGMPQDIEQPNEGTKLLSHAANDRRLSTIRHEDQQSIIGSYVSEDEQALSAAPIGERLPYNDYTTIDWLHDLVRNPTSELREAPN